MKCICDGTGHAVEYGEHSYQCCEDGEALCVRCGDFATCENGNGEFVCTPHYYEWEQEEAA